MPDLRYDRLYRTEASEAYLISQGEQTLARLELHLGAHVVYGVLLFEEEPTDAELRALVTRIDEDLVWTAGVARDDFAVWAYVARELGMLDDEARESGNGTGPTGDGGGH